MRYEFKVDMSKFARVLSDLTAAIERAKRVALNQIGNTIKNRAIDSFKDESLRPSPWPPRKTGTPAGTGGPKPAAPMEKKDAAQAARARARAVCFCDNTRRHGKTG